MTSREKNIYRLLTYGFVTVLVCHLLLATFFIFRPDRGYLTDSRFEKAYRLFGLTGPFFPEDRINVVPHVYCSVKFKNSDYGPFKELGKEEFHSYHENYLRYDQFLLSGLPRYLSRQIQLYQDTAANASNLLTMKEYIWLTNSKQVVDSAIVVYTLDYLTEERTDTLFTKYIGFDQLLVE